MENKNYFAVIPADVRYNKNLTANAKLLYGEITALCNEKGFCWASNKYFSDLYNVDKATISRWIKQLVKYKYVSVKLTYKKGSKEVDRRTVKIINTPPQNCGEGGHKIVKDIYNHNDYVNNTINNSVKSKKAKNFVDFPAEVQGLFLNLNKLFDENLLPKTKDKKRQWVKTIDDLWRLDNYHPRKVFTIIDRARKDPFWNEQFLSILKLRKRNKDGLKYVEYFEHKFGKDLMKVKFDKYPNV